jgi:ubiquinone/menaquinone biosynthesis C-methylase UbiE
VKRSTAEVYRCPYTKDSLQLIPEQCDRDEVLTGSLLAPSGAQYRVQSGVAFLCDASLAMDELEKKTFDYYQTTSSAYDTALDWLFRTFLEDEEEVRQRLIGPLKLEEAKRVLEIGCGTCRDTVRIAARLSPGSQLFLQDFSPAILHVGRERMQSSGPFACELEYFVGNVAHLPFADGYFDCVYHFGALNVFSNKKNCLAEMTRVVRTGGRIVVGDESLAPWLRKTEYGRILLDANPLYGDDIPLDDLPECARDVQTGWLLGNAFYFIDYRVGEGPPPVDLDLPIPGPRGGTLRSRHYGKLEAVTPEAKKMAEREARRLGISVHEWLDRAVRAVAGSD